MYKNLKWVSENQYSIILPESGKAKYEFIDQFVEENFDSLMDHKIENIDKEELTEHILDAYQFMNEIEIQELIYKLYEIIFQYIYLPAIQIYGIDYQIITIENILDKFDSLVYNNQDCADDLSDFLAERSKKSIEDQKAIYKEYYGIEEFEEIPLATTLNCGNFMDLIIKKYAVNKDLLKF